ncbi:MAG: UDP-N-acetylglucosamine 1-carboxyvinyltransferase [Gammaproteobacteria bacterium]|jgi:UDP-N-acetylglucosamine 1-carboxyvinyltransferase|nr:MAG: UDP-N-acetylglucosamine 1-carboxyvinyltransferase [Gammaproteobacteria bacterium]|tara:strand:+ start:266 stop:1531 length:1266 start_codon:yes stop_codon:yes gene_type:complete
MERLIIKGGNQLHGEVDCSGAKNAGLPILASTILLDGVAKIGNLPHLQDITTMLELLNSMGSHINFDENGYIEINSSNIDLPEARYELVKTMRASILVMGPLVAKYGKAKISQPGGCDIGSRPIDFHLSGLEKMGAEIKSDSKYIYLKADKLKPIEFEFPKISVTGTENLMMAAVFTEGKTTLKNCAKEPEVVELANFLNKCGASIHGAGESTIEITGVDSLGSVEWDVLFDRIEAGTYLVAGAITNGHITVKKIEPKTIQVLTNKLIEMGVNVSYGENWVEADATSSEITCVDIDTEPFPGFPTDMQAQFMALNTIATGSCTIEETVFENRFQHVSQLRKMGADIVLSKNKAFVKGVPNLVGSEVKASDLRASASLVLAGLVGKNRTQIDNIYHIDRGYECIEEKLNKLGADIIREPVVY